MLNKISLDVDPGQITGLVGLNGVGKTTLIKIILTLLDADAGDVRLFGKAAGTMEAKRHYAYLPEKFTPSQFLTGREYISLSLSYYQKSYDHKKAQHVADLLGLHPDFLNARISSYSKGMGQKIGLIAAFLQEVPLLILDEPMSGLDPQARIQLKHVMQAYVKKGNAIFLSSHILSDMDELCKKIAVLHDGILRYTGTPALLRKQQKEKSLETAFLKKIAA